jgi:mono/diheme cytochrome c family protein
MGTQLYFAGKSTRKPRTASRLTRVGVASVSLLGAGVALAIVNQFGDLQRVDRVHDKAFTARADQFAIRIAAFDEVFEAGDVFFDTAFNALDGGGANVGRGQRFTRVPRADLRGPSEWFNHLPERATGPNAQACTDCHREPGDGAGPAGSNVHRDPLRNGNVGQFIQRNTPHLFGGAAVQVLAEEMTEALHAQRDSARQQACSRGTATQSLSAKGVSFGSIKANRTSQSPCRVSFDTSDVNGVSSDLVVRPFQWKGSVATVRDFVRGASHNELGVTPDELLANPNADSDGDGVVSEATVGDMTALAVYIAAQPRPTTLTELNNLGLLDSPLTQAQIAAINRGAAVFNSSGARCATCHVPTLTVNDPVFVEPSLNRNYRDETFPGGGDPRSAGLDPQFANRFNFTTDLPDNPVPIPGGTTLGNFARNSQGQAIVQLFGDLKRHNMGSGLAESVDEVGTGAGTFLTENLWGVATTAPYMHDGRATTLAEAILEHGGEAQASASFFRAAVDANRSNPSDTRAPDLIAALENLVLFFEEEE